MSKSGFTGSDSNLVERVTVRFTEAELSEIDALVDEGHYPNRSEVIRDLMAEQPGREDVPTMYVVTGESSGGKKRHKPASGSTITPACRTTNDDGDWLLKTRRQTIFYTDCSRCFPQGGDS